MDTLNARILVRRDTTNNWNAIRSFIPMRGEIIVYTDAGSTDDGNGNIINVPGIKIGDGNAYLLDLPFVGSDTAKQILQELREHSQNSLIHVSQQDRTSWDNKISCHVDNERLLLTN